jgi:phosphatidate cytidylyltransferase
MVLAFASITVSIKTYLRPDNALRLQINAWWRIFPLISLGLYWHSAGIFILTLLICSLAARELAQYFIGVRWHFWIMCLIIFVTVFALQHYAIPPFVFLLPGLLIAQLLLFCIRPVCNHLLLSLFFVLSYSLSFINEFSSLLFTSELIVAWSFYLFAITALNDVAQFVSGTRFGKQKIAVSISPNKTWQGLAGGVIISVLVSVVLGNYLRLTDISSLILLGIMLSIGGFFGDLLFSVAKRFLGIKDFSNLIPGHGGILDRADSLVATAPLLYFFLYLTHYGLLK